MIVRSILRNSFIRFGIVALIAFVAGAVWFKGQLWPYIDIQDIYVRLKYEMTSRMAADGSLQPAQKPDRYVYIPKTRTLNDLDRISKRLRQIGFSRKAVLVNTSEQADGKLTYGIPKGDIETSASRIETFIFDIGADCQSKSWLLSPPKSNGEIEKLLIVHQGHSIYLTNGPVHPSNDIAPIIKEALNAGIHVGVFHMPMWSRGTRCEIEYVDPITGPVKIFDHIHFESAPSFEETFGFHPFAMFLSPVKAFIDQLEKTSPNMRVYMTGLSGGGWMSSVYSAIDDRIEISFPVAGSIPFSIRSYVDMGPRDYENHYISTFADYSDIYVLATMRNGRFERHHVSMFNDSDLCCFASKHFNTESLENAINASIAELGGKNSEKLYKVFESHNVRHSINSESVAYILKRVLAD